MNEHEHELGAIEVEYYLLDGQEIGKAYFDAEADEYTGGEILSRGGQWQAYPAGSIIADGEPISRAEAKKWVKKLMKRC